MLTVQSEALMYVDRLFLHKYQDLPASESLNWSRTAVKYFLMRAANGNWDIVGEDLLKAILDLRADWVANKMPEIEWRRVHQFLLYLEGFSRHPVHHLSNEIQRMLEHNYVEIQYNATNLVFNQYQVIRAVDLLMSHASLEPFNAAS